MSGRNCAVTESGEREMSKFAVILPAAGKSTRFGDSRRKKVFVDLAGRPVWIRAAEHFTNRDDVAQVLVVVSPEDLEFFKDKFRPNLAFMSVEIVTGGAERADSVRNALARVRTDIEFVAVHDAARPVLAKEWVDDVFREAGRTGAAILATPVSNTLKRATEAGTILETVPRDRIWAAQTPQVFRREWLMEAYSRQGNLRPTDEAQLVEATGRAVSLVECPPINIKITSPGDMKFAELALGALPKPKGITALHPFADDDLFR
jgi:2-C-methyl-D-erythritol 4-phosphate cytidylyltransferase